MKTIEPLRPQTPPDTESNQPSKSAASTAPIDSTEPTPAATPSATIPTASNPSPDASPPTAPSPQPADSSVATNSSPTQTPAVNTADPENTSPTPGTVTVYAASKSGLSISQALIALAAIAYALYVLFEIFTNVKGSLPRLTTILPGVGSFIWITVAWNTLQAAILLWLGYKVLRASKAALAAVTTLFFFMPLPALFILYTITILKDPTTLIRLLGSIDTIIFLICFTLYVSALLLAWTKDKNRYF